LKASPAVVSNDELRQRADKAIRPGRSERSRTLTLATNPQFRPAAPIDMNTPAEDETAGTAYLDDPEPTIAEAAIADRFIREIATTVALPNLQDWVQAQKAERGGLPRLAADMLHLPLSRETRQRKDFRAELRKLEEYAQGKYKSARGPRRARIAELMADRPSPYMPPTRAAQQAIRRVTDLVLIVVGDWAISGDLHMGTGRTIEENHPSDSHTVLLNGGHGFIQEVIRAYRAAIRHRKAGGPSRASVELLRVRGLRVQYRLQ
jgi:hypothetical protein